MPCTVSGHTQRIPTTSRYNQYQAYFSLFRSFRENMAWEKASLKPEEALIYLYDVGSTIESIICVRSKA